MPVRSQPQKYSQERTVQNEVAETSRCFSPARTRQRDRGRYPAGQTWRPRTGTMHMVGVEGRVCQGISERLQKNTQVRQQGQEQSVRIQFCISESRPRGVWDSRLELMAANFVQQVFSRDEGTSCCDTRKSGSTGSADGITDRRVGLLGLPISGVADRCEYSIQLIYSSMRISRSTHQLLFKQTALEQIDFSRLYTD